jgi:hypothetical protein
MKLNKEMIKRYSTYANAISLILGGMMIYFPEIIPKEYVPYVMCICSGLVGACQAFKQGVGSVIANQN